MYDIHCHLIPGIDDGADILDETLQMLRLAASGRTRGVICTPHCNIPGTYQNYYDADFEKRFRSLKRLTVEQRIPVDIYLGQEIFLSGDISRLLREEKLITLNRSAYLLCEFDPYERIENACSKLERICAEGYIPIVAHPERYHFITEIPSAADRLKAIGALLQINKGSLTGAFGHAATQAAHRLLERRKADFIASDAHSPYIRTPFLGDAHEIVSEHYSMHYADHLLFNNPLRVIRNQKIYCY